MPQPTNSKYDAFFLSTKMKALTKAFETAKANEVESVLKELTKMVTESSGNQIYSAFVMRDTLQIFYASEYGAYPLSDSYNLDDISGFTKIFSIAKKKWAKNNILFLTYLFETLLNKLDEADHNLKNIVLAIFSESKNGYADALLFYLSQLNPEKIKDILCGDKLITKIIDIKSTFSKESDLRNTLNELQKYHEEGLYFTRDNLCKKLKTEVNRLRNKRFLSATDIELSNILLSIKMDLKMGLTHFSSGGLTIGLNTQMTLLEHIQSNNKLDAETIALLTTIKMIKPWYLLEFRKDEKNFVDELLSIASTPILPAKAEDKNPIAKKEVIAATETRNSFPAEKAVTTAPTVTAAPRIITPQPKAATREKAYPSFFDDLKRVEAIVIPTHNPAVAGLKVPKGPIKQDIIDELFYPVECKI